MPSSDTPTSDTPRARDTATGHEPVGAPHSQVAAPHRASGPHAATDPEPESSLMLPPGARLLYIGPYKTGTTAIQEAARRARTALYDHGVYYPGSGQNQQVPLYAFLGKRAGSLNKRLGVKLSGAKGAHGPAAPPKSQWTALLADLDREPDRRIFLSHEAVSGASDELARRMVSELGPESVHIAISVRSPAAMLASRWVERLKSGVDDSLEEWLERFYGFREPAIQNGITRGLRLGELVERWAAAAGPDRVTVIVADKAHRTALPSTFEQLLGLPPGMLSAAAVDGAGTNRSLTLPEAHLLHGMNSLVSDGGTTPATVYGPVVRQGIVRHLQRQRPVPAAEPKVRLPRWAEELADRDAQRDAERITRAGVRVVGDLHAVLGPGGPRPAEAPGEVTEADHEELYRIAAHALAGALEGATVLQARADRELARSTPSHQPAADASRGQDIAGSFTTRELARAVGRRLRYRVRRGTSMPVR